MFPGTTTSVNLSGCFPNHENLLYTSFVYAGGMWRTTVFIREDLDVDVVSTLSKCHFYLSYIDIESQMPLLLLPITPLPARMLIR